MNLESLRIFIAVAADSSITQASARLGRAPSNVTTRIQQLGGEHGGVLHIGCMESTAASRLPAVLAAYHVDFPDTELQVMTGTSGALLEQVRTGGLDCAFAALPPALQEAGALAELGLSAKPIWRESLVLLLPESEVDVTAPAQVRTRSLAAFKQGCTYRAIAQEALGVADDPEWKVQELGSYHGMVACVAAGACVALLPESVLSLTKTPTGLKTLPLGHADTSLIWRTDYDVPAFQHLLEQLDGVQI